jgi:hypothetical protein
MATKQQRSEIERLEKAFWQSMVDGEPEVATDMLAEPALMVSGHGAIKFDHAAYAKMANDDRHRLVGYRFSDMDVIFPKEDVAIASYRVNQKVEMQGKPVEKDVYDTSTWIRVGDQWRCVMHTESDLAPRQ